MYEEVEWNGSHVSICGLRWVCLEMDFMKLQYSSKLQSESLRSRKIWDELSIAIMAKTSVAFPICLGSVNLLMSVKSSNLSMRATVPQKI